VLGGNAEYLGLIGSGGWVVGLVDTMDRYDRSLTFTLIKGAQIKPVFDQDLLDQNLIVTVSYLSNLDCDEATPFVVK
jgi:hypothetical protein